jgi:hypothetical protein
MITKSQLFKVFTAILTAVIALTSFNACKEDSLETKGFVLYYTGMTDIGPSMSGIISSPTYKGGVPSGFAITSVSLEGSSYSGNAFTIDPNTGAISIVSTKDMVIGKYLISVSCLSDGKTCEFKDAVEVTFLKAVPESITVNPSTLEVQYSDVTGLTTGDLPTAQVETGSGSYHCHKLSRLPMSRKTEQPSLPRRCSLSPSPEKSASTEVPMASFRAFTSWISNSALPQ